MKPCPFCRESIQADAARCPHCTSELSESARPSSRSNPAPASSRVVFSLDRQLLRALKYSGVVLFLLGGAALILYLYGFHPTAQKQCSDQVTLILDPDLIRFAKFAGAVLAIFVTFGLFLYGIDIKQVAKEVRESAASARDLVDRAKLASEEMRKEGEAVAAERLESQRQLQQIRESADLVAKDREDTERMMIEFKELRRQAAEATEEIQRQAHNVIQPPLASLGQLSGSPTGPFTAVDTGSTAPSRRPEQVDSLTAPEIAHLYNFPSDLDGRGQCIGFIELGGGYRPQDLKAYFSKLDLVVPKITPVSVAGAKNSPSRTSAGENAQVTLDIEVAGGVAPGAHLAVYFAPNTNQGFLLAIRTALSDEKNKPSVLSISWGGPEPSWNKETMAEFNQAFREAAAKGVTVICAVGDNGVTDGVLDNKPHVDFPAASPWVLACGGTRLSIAGDEIHSEVVWNDGDGATGGGVSSVFPRPDWQVNARVPVQPTGFASRGIPDVAAHASPKPGYRAYMFGNWTMVGGTAAATPLWAGLIACLNQGLGRNVGFVNPLLYSKLGPAGILRGITQGDNGVKGVQGYQAGPGWNPCTGWGSPNGTKLFAALSE